MFNRNEVMTLKKKYCDLTFKCNQKNRSENRFSSYFPDMMKVESGV